MGPIIKKIFQFKGITYTGTIGIILLMILCPGLVAEARTIYVGPGEEFTSIQPAIDAAVNNDIIIVKTSIYSGPANKNLDFLGKAITLRSENGPENTIIDCQQDGRGFYFHSEETNLSVVEGFTIRNTLTTFNGGAIDCWNSSPTITNCIISGNRTISIEFSAGGGICCSSSSPEITDCVISGNEAGRGGGGIFCESSSPEITNCIISGNTVLANDGGQGGGIFCYQNSSPTITNCIISKNTAPFYGGGVYCGDPQSSITITNCTISGNISGRQGGGIYCNNSSPNITNCILWDNSPSEIDTYGASSNPIVRFSDIQGGYGSGNINQNPRFVNPSGDDYHLQSNSPCIDAGTSGGAPNTDIEGNPRPLCIGYDMGAYEFQCNTPASSGSYTPSDNIANVEVTFPNVTTGGQTTISMIEDCTIQEPAGYTLNLLEPCYDIQTTATFDGLAEICITFDLASIPAPPGINNLRMMRCDPAGGNCQAITTSPATDNGDGTGTLCAETNHLSIFALTTIADIDSDEDGWLDPEDNCPTRYDPSNLCIITGKVFNDAYSFEDNFKDLNGLNLTETHNFEIVEGILQSTAASAVAVSESITLPQPEGGTFLEWSFLTISLSDIGGSTNTLEIQDCFGNTLMVVNDLPEGESTLDLSGINVSALRLQWTTNQAGTKLNFWHIYGKAEGATSIKVVPSSDMVNSGDTVTFTITLSTSGAKARNPVLSFSLDDINGLHTPDIDDGLAEDAEVDYGWGNGVQVYRPLEFVSAGNGPNGEMPTAPAIGATSGEVIWNLQDLNDGFSDNVIVTLKVPRGYINGKTLAARAVLDHGMISGSYSNMMTEEETSGLVTVNSVSTYRQSVSRGYNDVGPGATNIFLSYTTPRILESNASDSDISDIEDVTMKIYPEGTCTPLFREVISNDIKDYQIVQAPDIGSPITEDNPVIVHYDRGLYYARNRIYIYFDVPDNCPDGSTIGTRSEIMVANPPWTDIDSWAFDVIFEPCRKVKTIVGRTMSGNDPGDYNIWPGSTEYQITAGSLRAGEYFVTLIHGNSTNRTHTVPLDHSYFLIEIPDGLTFHGIRFVDTLDRIYKDSTHTAPIPTDAAFDHHSDPPHPAWKLVETTWSGVPFTNPPDDNDPEAVIVPGTRLLMVKDNDDPPWLEPDRGAFSPRVLWRICDGSYGCAELPEESCMSLIETTVFTYETVSDQEGAVHQCIEYPGRSLYKESKSWPKVYTLSNKNQVPAGQLAQIIINPENQNKASQWVDGRWVVNLYGIRDYLNLAGITGEVLIDGLNIPAPDQNITGMSCNMDDITFHFPDPAACNAAISENDEACMAWWEVPAACQPPNGWGYPIANISNHNNYVPMYQFRLNAPILNTTPANTTLDFVAEVRTNDLTAQGADNAVDPARWPTENYTATISITALDLPGLDLTLSGPVTRKLGDSFTYTCELVNYGNTPNDGWYMVVWLPREGINNSEFTPEYSQLYINQAPEDVMVEWCQDQDCFANPLAGTWDEAGLQQTTRTGYLAETTSPINQNATCVRLRRNPDSTARFNPGDSLLGAMDMLIPDDISLEGKWIYSRALSGASIAFGAGSDLSPVETVNTRTKVSSETALEIKKSFEIDTTKAGWVTWIMWVHNTSGTEAINVSVVDQLPDSLIYEGLAGPLPSGWSLLQEPSPGTPGGTLQLLISQLQHDDGNAGGDDETTIAFLSRVNEEALTGNVIETCATASPEMGSGDTGCISISLPQLDLIKEQQATDRIEATPDELDIYPGDTIIYTITAINRSDQAVFLHIYDILDEYLAYTPGTFTVNGARASDSFVSGGILDYEYADPVNPNKILVLTLEVTVTTVPETMIVQETAQASACINPLDPSTCTPGKESSVVEVQVICDETDHDGDGFSFCKLDCNDNDDTVYPGAPEICDGKDNDCDGELTACDKCLTDIDTDKDGIGDVCDNCPDFYDPNNQCEGLRMSLPANWSMISLNVAPEGPSSSILFPEAIVIYGYQKGSGYVRIKGDDKLEPGKGYWILLSEAKTYSFPGQSIDEYTIPAEDGWFMIGGCSYIAKATLNIGEIKVIYSYEQGSGYQRVSDFSNIRTGKGYWILFKNTNEQSEFKVAIQF